MRTISRRDFLKSAAAGAMGVAVAGVLGACGGEAAATAAEATTAAETTAANTTAEASAAAAPEGTTAGGEAPGGEGGGPGGPGGPGGQGGQTTKEVLIDASDPFRVTGEDGKTVYYSMRRTWVGEPPAIADSDIAGEHSADIIRLLFSF